MKNVALIFALFFMAFVNANEITNKKTTVTLNNNRYHSSYNQPLKFIERGVEFFVFPNGEFDFNTHPRYHRSNYRRSNFRRSRTDVNITFGTPRSHNRRHYNRGVRIEHDHLGRVRRIGNVFINYDNYGRIKRAGSVYMNYRHNWLTRIGGLHIFYNRYHEIVSTSGFIKYNMGCHFCGTLNCTINHYDHHNNWDNDDDWGSDNDDMYYYRKGKKATKRKKR